MAHSIDLKNLEFHEELGEGAFGTVNRVTFKEPFKGHIQAVAKSVWSLKNRDVEMLCELEHPNIAKILGFYTHGPLHMILIEYAPNGSLRDYLSDYSKPLPEELMHKWFMESASAIEQLQGHDFLHTDIKANNCLLFHDYVLKLSDFGLAPAINHYQGASGQKGIYCYTCMAPEIQQESDKGITVYSKPADIYAYGMLILEIYTRKPPFAGLDWKTLISRIGRGEKPALPDNCPPMLSEIMKCCWNSNPKERPTIQDIIKAISAGVFKRQTIPQDQIETQATTEQASWISMRPIPPPLYSASYIGSSRQGKWTQVRTVFPYYQNTFLRVLKISCFPNGDMVIGGNLQGQLYIIDANGQFKMKLIVPEADTKKHIGTVCSIAVSSQGHVLAADDTRYVKIFDCNGKYLHNLTTPTSDIAIDKKGHIVVGDMVYTCPEGKLINTLNCYGERHMAVNSRNQILFNYFAAKSAYDKVVVIDYSGKEVITFVPRIDEDVAGNLVIIRGIKCDLEDNIYLAMSVRRNYEVIRGTGHIHRYSPTGKFIRCIACGLGNPSDIAMSFDGSLVVANFDSILVYNLK
ncbi:uncharacterized protein [Amphiura filiformis]|uniref:uncharacterized protein n=1 Tax=Amphiura filiformis TaxID=82378 RepID=UPI003B2220BB